MHFILSLLLILREPVQRFIWLSVACVFSLGLSGQTAFASTASSQAKIPRKQDSSWTTSIGFGLGHESLVSGHSDVGAQTHDERAYLNWRLKSPERSQFRLGTNGTFGAPLTREGNTQGREYLIEVPELYGQWVDAPGGETHTFFNLGRKLETWSELDSAWNLGIWQPLNRFDGARPTEQGLTGAFIGHQGPGFRALVFASPIFVPEQGPAFELIDGRFHAKNPWFAPPTDRLIVLNRENEIHYALEVPPVDSIVNHASIGGLLRFGEGPKKEGPTVQLAFAHKPRNQLSLPYDGYVDMKKAYVNVSPRVIYHDVFAFDSFYKFQNVRLGLTVLSELPSVSDQVPPNLTGQILGPMVFVSPSLEVRAFQSRYWGPKLKLAWLDSYEDGTKMVGPLASGDENPFGARTMFRRALQFEASSLLYRIAGWSVDQRFRWIEEFAEEGRMLMFDLGVSVKEAWRLGLYADLFQSRQPDDVNPGFISRFRGNDRVGARFSVAF